MASMPPSRTLQADAATPARAAAAGPYVINLCSSTTPMALAQPDAPELKRFTFFMSRRREDGRERFRLHMGYFVTAAEADEWLNVVREIFPGAWVGEAPGKRLRERQAENERSAVNGTEPAAQPAQARSVQAAAGAARPVQPQAHRPQAPQPPRGARIPTVQPAAAPSSGRGRAPAAPGRESNVREVLAALDGPGAQAPRAAHPAPARPAARPVATPAQAIAAATTQSTMSDTQVLRILEERSYGGDARAPDEADNAIALLKPEDTGTRRALAEAVSSNQPVSFAVQLQSSAQPIDLASVPPLAIFSAYTLYTVEGSREGRRWFGLRLGFFSDSHSAKQVAYYVRSEFASVAVVPVTGQERTRATEERRQSPAFARPIPVKAAEAEEFKLIDDTPAAPARESTTASASVGMPARRPAAPNGKGVSKAPRPVARVQATARSRPQTLEETLEILGASQLEMDRDRGELLNDSGGVRHLKVQVKKNTAFTRLLDHLAERVKKF